MAGAAAALLGVVLAVQFAFAYLSTALPPLAAALRERRRGEEGGAAKTRAATAARMAWACTRSVIGLVLALSLPPSFDYRGLVLVVAALLILGSVLLQGLTLRPAVLAAALGREAEDKQEQELATRARQRRGRGGWRGRVTASTPRGAPCSSCARRTGSATRRCARCCGKPTSRPAPPRARPPRYPARRRPTRESARAVLPAA